MRPDTTENKIAFIRKYMKAPPIAKANKSNDLFHLRSNIPAKETIDESENTPKADPENDEGM